jgi:hypothetical protein
MEAPKPLSTLTLALQRPTEVSTAACAYAAKQDLEITSLRKLTKSAAEERD